MCHKAEFNLKIFDSRPVAFAHLPDLEAPTDDNYY